MYHRVLTSSMTFWGNHGDGSTVAIQVERGAHCPPHSSILDRVLLAIIVLNEAPDDSETNKIAYKGVHVRTPGAPQDLPWDSSGSGHRTFPWGLVRGLIPRGIHC